MTSHASPLAEKALVTPPAGTTLNLSLPLSVPAYRPLRVLICGEINAGKSTVINALLRGPFLPDNIGQSMRPRITVRHGAQPALEVREPGGAKRPTGADDGPDVLRGAEDVILWTDAPQIADLELTELPITVAEEITEADLDAMRRADVLIWVTIASQAWRLTEKTILARFGETLPQDRLIVVSRADKLRSAKDREKLLGRIRRETGQMFAECLLLNGATRTLAATATSEDHWARSGAPSILDVLTRIAAERPREAIDTADDSAIENLVDLATFRRSSEVSPPPAPLLAPLSQDKLSALAPLIDRLPSGSVAGWLGSECQVLSGSQDRADETAGALRHALSRQAAAYATHEIQVSPESLLFASASTRIACEIFPDGGVLFVLADASRFSAGIAKTMMEQMREALQDAS